MLILAIDSALDALGLALAEDGAARGLVSETMNRGQAERIAPAARDLMQAAGVAFSDIDRLVVTTGPGSFTGVRVGLAFARGLALALAKPIVGISTLEALALETGAAGMRGALIETPGSLYIALYEHGCARLAPERVERDAVAARLTQAADGRAFSLRGPGAAAWGGRIMGADCVDVIAPDPLALARLGAARDPAHAPPAPLYLRAALA